MRFNSGLSGKSEGCEYCQCSRIFKKDSSIFNELWFNSFANKKIKSRIGKYEDKQEDKSNKCPGKKVVLAESHETVPLLKRKRRGRLYKHFSKNEGYGKFSNEGSGRESAGEERV